MSRAVIDIDMTSAHGEKQWQKMFELSYDAFGLSEAMGYKFNQFWT